MALHRMPETTSLSLNLAPMVDVVMCLIIFFMLATKMVERENSAVNLPVALAAGESEKRELGRRVVVNVLGAPQAGEGAPRVRYVIEDREVGLGEVSRRLNAERKADAQVRCVVRADRELACRDVEELLATARRAGIVNVVFAVSRERAGR